jgi:hypothetical protein
VRERERERSLGGGSEKHYIKWGQEKYIFDFEGSQEVPVRPSGEGKIYDQN